ncbi:MAG TPA: hypothetical protein HA257_06065 [Candidatus Methanoperedenaceae archaeon]|nr:hypothetical protein [Candidatus Methanoperedenaceae archaeon]
MNARQKDIAAALLWIVSIAAVLILMYFLYGTDGKACPYHEKVFPGRSVGEAPLSEAGRLAEYYSHLFMELLDFGIPVFAILIGHHLLMSYRKIKMEGHHG